jgi:hypothetical protein
MVFGPHFYSALCVGLPRSAGEPDELGQLMELFVRERVVGRDEFFVRPGAVLVKALEDG